MGKPNNIHHNLIPNCGQLKLTRTVNFNRLQFWTGWITHLLQCSIGFSLTIWGMVKNLSTYFYEQLIFCSSTTF